MGVYLLAGVMFLLLFTVLQYVLEFFVFPDPLLWFLCLLWAPWSCYGILVCYGVSCVCDVFCCMCL